MEKSNGRKIRIYRELMNKEGGAKEWTWYG